MQYSHEGLSPRPSLRNRSASLSTDSQHFHKSSMLSPPLVVPQPQYISASSAAQIVAADQDLDAFDHSGNSGGVQFTSSALASLNGFLDHLLFSILLASRSTKLLAIRPAVSEVLKPRLAKEVVSAADEELREYTGGSDEKELSDFHGGQEPSGHFELERSWKLTRLKCMVFTRLGDMEEEDEESYLQQEGLDNTDLRSAPFSLHVGHITPAAAIFLTSILEYIGECAIVLAGEAAQVRTTSSRSSGDDQERAVTPAEEPKDLIVEDGDVEKLALNATLGRLWRMWKKNVRAPTLSRTLSRESIMRRGRTPSKATSRQSSVGTVEPIDELHQPREVSPEPPLSEATETLDPTAIPLPPSGEDGDEIEAAGPAKLAIAVPARSVRPRSLILSTSSAAPGVKSPSSGRLHIRSASLPRDTHPFDLRSRESAVAEGPQKVSSEKDTGDSARQPTKLTVRTSLRASDTGTGSYYDDAASRVSSIGSDHEAGGPSDLSDGQPSPITCEEAELLQRKTLENYSAQASESHATTGPQSPDEDQPVQLSRMKSIRDSEPREHSIGYPSTTTTSSHVEYHKPGLNKVVKPSPVVETSFVSQEGKSESQHPRLVQLREAVKAANSTPPHSSYENSRSRQSEDIQEPRSAPAVGHRSQHSLPVSATYQRSPKGASYSPETATSTGSDRAAVQRVGAPSGGQPRRSGSITSAHDSRRPKTSTSHASQASGKFKNLKSSGNYRASSETSRSPSKTAEYAAQERSDLESLIQSDETIHYTLTPRNMREMEDPDSPRWTPVRADETQDVQQRSRKFSDSAMTTSARSGRSRAASETQYQMPQKASRQSAKPKTSLQAREPTTELESLREFADFIRATGPAQSDDTRQANGQPANAKANAGKVNNRISKSPGHTPLVAPPAGARPNSKKPGPKLEARSAVTPKDEQTSELIDFIRDGPPGAGVQRVPKSRDVTAASSAASTHDSSTISKSHNSSVNSHTGLLDSSKRTDARARVAQPSHLRSIPSGPPQGDHAPVRKQRKARDPYAIDFDSDDEVVETQPRGAASQAPRHGSAPNAPVRKQRRARDPYDLDAIDDDLDYDELSAAQPKDDDNKEESLADFLRNSEPPPTNGQQPQLLSMNMAAQGNHPPPKKSAMSAVKSRLMRSPSTDKRPKQKSSLSTFQSTKPVSNSSAGAGSRRESNAPMQQSNQAASRPIQAHSLQVGPAANGSSATSPRPVQQQGPRNDGGNLTPRTDGPQRLPAASGGRQTETAALADFLRNTGPPEPQGVQSRPSIDESKDSRGLGKMFTRKKGQMA